MLEWAKEATKHLVQSDLLELYCGNGNFTVALAENFRLVPLIWVCYKLESVRVMHGITFKLNLLLVFGRHGMFC